MWLVASSFTGVPQISDISNRKRDRASKVISATGWSLMQKERGSPLPSGPLPLSFSALLSIVNVLAACSSTSRDQKTFHNF